jgi:peptidoglycan hydrolase CwlO-like protein
MPESLNNSILSLSEFNNGIQRINSSLARRQDLLDAFTHKIKKTQTKITSLQEEFKTLELESEKLYTEIKKLDLNNGTKKNLSNLEVCER